MELGWKCEKCLPDQIWRCVEACEMLRDEIGAVNSHNKRGVEGALLRMHHNTTSFVSAWLRFQHQPQRASLELEARSDVAVLTNYPRSPEAYDSNIYRINI